MGDNKISCLGDLNSSVNKARLVTYRQRIESAVHSKISKAVKDNLDFVSADSMACDKFVTKVLSDSGVKPDDWPDPDWASVKDYRSYMKSELRRIASQGWNVVIMHSVNPTITLKGRVYKTDPTPPSD